MAVLYGHAGRLTAQNGGVRPGQKLPINPLIQAATTGSLEVLKLLLGAGATADAVCKRTGATAFQYACYHNQPDCVEALVRAGCDVGIKAKDGQTGRETAALAGHTAVCRSTLGHQQPYGQIYMIP